MKVDRYTKVVLTVIAVALSALAFKDIVAPQPAPVTGEGRYQIAMDGAAGIVVVDTRSGTLYNARGATGRVLHLDTRTGYPQ